MGPQLSLHSLGARGAVILYDSLGPSLLLRRRRHSFARHTCREKGDMYIKSSSLPTASSGPVFMSHCPEPPVVPTLSCKRGSEAEYPPGRQGERDVARALPTDVICGANRPREVDQCAFCSLITSCSFVCHN